MEKHGCKNIVFSSSATVYGNPERVPFICGNWKMFKTPDETRAFAEAFNAKEFRTGRRIGICAPYIDLDALREGFEGTWVDFNNPMKRYEEHSVVSYDAPIEVLPLFVRAGAFIPQAMGKMENVGDYNPARLEVLYFASDKASSFTMFDDDLHSTGTLAAGKHRLITFSAQPQGDSCLITIASQGTIAGAKGKKDYTLVLPGMDKLPSAVTINGKKASRVSLDKARGAVTIAVPIADVARPTTVQITR